MDGIVSDSVFSSIALESSSTLLSHRIREDMPSMLAENSTPPEDLHLARILSIIFGLIGMTAMMGILCIVIHRRRTVEAKTADKDIRVCVERAMSTDHDPNTPRQPMRALHLLTRPINSSSRATRTKSMTLPIHSPPPALIQNRHSSADVGRNAAYPEIAYIPIAPPRRHREPAQPRRPPGLIIEPVSPSLTPTTGTIIIHPPRVRQIQYPSVPPPTYAESMRLKNSTR